MGLAFLTKHNSLEIHPSCCHVSIVCSMVQIYHYFFHSSPVEEHLRYLQFLEYLYMGFCVNGFHFPGINA